MNSFINRLAVALGLAFVGTVAMLPHLLHVLDRGSMTAEASNFTDDALPTRNVTITGRLDYESEVLLTKTKSRRGQIESVDHTTYIPLQGRDGQGVPGTTIVLLSNEGDLGDQTAKGPALFGEAPSDDTVTVTGTVRNLLWEGHHGSIRSRFEEAGLPGRLTDHLIVIEVRGRHETSDAVWGVWLPAGLFLLGLVLGGRRAAAPGVGQPTAVAS